MVMIGVDPNYEQRALGQFSLPPRAYEPGALDGVGGAIADAPFRLASRIPLAIGMAASGIAWRFDEEVGGAMFRQNERLYGRAADYWTPDARTTGTAAQVVGGVAEIVPALFLGPAAAPVIAGTTTASTGRDLVRSGVDGATAGAVAAAQGVAIAAGFAAPAAIGRTLGQRVASGAAINVATGAGGDAVSSAVLQAGGYDQQAERFNPMDLTARGIDLLLGAAFGAAAHLGAPKDFDQQMRPADKDAILALSNRNHAANATGPGRPVTQLDAGKQQANVAAAIEQLVETGRVDASTLPETDIAFRPEAPLADPETVRAGVEEGLREAGALSDAAEVPRDATADIVADVMPTGDAMPAPEVAEPQRAAPARLAEQPEVADTLAAIESDPELAAFRIEDEDGNQASLADVVRGAVAESEQAAGLGAGFRAAAMCFLRNLA